MTDKTFEHEDVVKFKKKRSATGLGNTSVEILIKAPSWSFWFLLQMHSSNLCQAYELQIRVSHSVQDLLLHDRSFEMNG